MDQRSLEATPVDGLAPEQDSQKNNSQSGQGLPSEAPKTVERARSEAAKYRIKARERKEELEAAQSELQALRAEKAKRDEESAAAEKKRLEEQGRWQELYKESQAKLEALESLRQADMIRAKAIKEMARAGITDPKQQKLLLSPVLDKAEGRVEEGKVKGGFKKAAAEVAATLGISASAATSSDDQASSSEKKGTKPRAAHPVLAIATGQVPSDTRHIPATRGDSVANLAHKLRIATNG